MGVKLISAVAKRVKAVEIAAHPVRERLAEVANPLLVPEKRRVARSEAITKDTALMENQAVAKTHAKRRKSGPARSQPTLMASALLMS